ncbi:MAG: pilus assembly protein [Marinicaulis sp.]|nr:pilus assembly protein [Marinicaulis sp.]
MRRDLSGAALVEFTLVAPLLLGLAFGMAETGRAFHQHHIVEKSVKDAARYAARAPADWQMCSTLPTNWGTIAGNAQNVALRGTLDGSAPLLLDHWNNTSTVTISVACVTKGTMISPVFNDDIPVITVSATVPFDDIGLLGFLGLSTFSTTTAHSEMWIGG